MTPCLNPECDREGTIMLQVYGHDVGYCCAVCSPGRWTDDSTRLLGEAFRKVLTSSRYHYISAGYEDGLWLTLDSTWDADDGLTVEEMKLVAAVLNERAD